MNAQPIIDSRNAVEFRVVGSPIREMLLSLGVPPNIYGYAYISYAVELLLQNEEYPGRHSNARQHCKGLMCCISEDLKLILL